MSRLNADIGKALAAPEVRAKNKELFMAEIFSSPEQFMSLLRRANEEFGSLSRAGAIQPQ